MENEQEVPTLDLGRIGYEAYRSHTGGVNLAHGGPLPEWSGLEKKYVNAWNAAAFAIHEAVAKKAMQDVLADLALIEKPDRVPTQPEHPTPEQRIAPVQKPSIGRIVIYLHAEDLDAEVAFGAHACPAVVIRVAKWACNKLMLYVMSPFGGSKFVDGVKQGDGIGEWSWPERA